MFLERLLWISQIIYSTISVIQYDDKASVLNISLECHRDHSNIYWNTGSDSVGLRWAEEFLRISQVVPTLLGTTDLELDRSECHREEPILTPLWNCFFDSLFAAVIIIHKWHTSKDPAPLPVKVPLFSSQRDNMTLPTCEWLQKRRD